MRKVPPPLLEGFRLWGGHYGTKPGVMHGVFVITEPESEMVIMSSGVDNKYGWEHVSVSLSHRAPTWGEMCFVKGLFWEDDEVVIQYHPAKKDYVDCHQHCLHLWRPMRQRIPMPPTILVGPKGKPSEQHTGGPQATAAGVIDQGKDRPDERAGERAGAARETTADARAPDPESSGKVRADNT